MLDKKTVQAEASDPKERLKTCLGNQLRNLEGWEKSVCQLLILELDLTSIYG